MNKNRIAKRVVVAFGFLFLSSAPAPTSAQSNPPGAGPTPHVASPTARPKKDTPPTDYFAGLTLTEDQKAKIGEIRQNAKSRVDAVVKNEKLSPEQKDAFLSGYRRMENSEIFKVLTPEQQAEVRKRMRSQRAAEQQQQKRAVPATPPPK
jgi:Spy/CpxP family protein refolding chaperone